MGADTAGGERCGVNGTDSGQGAVRASLDIGLNVVQRGCGLAIGTGDENKGGQ